MMLSRNEDMSLLRGILKLCQSKQGFVIIFKPCEPFKVISYISPAIMLIDNWHNTKIKFYEPRTPILSDLKTLQLELDNSTFNTNSIDRIIKLHNYGYSQTTIYKEGRMLIEDINEIFNYEYIDE